jgi:hypothetical protein
MESDCPDILTYSSHRVWRARPQLSLVVALVLLFAGILGSFHHHNDWAEHPNCAICAGPHNTPTETSTPALTLIFLPDLPVLFVPLVLTVSTIRPTLLLRSRAPPP